MRFYHCKLRSVPVDYSAQLNSMKELSERILSEVVNYQSVVNVNLDPVIAELTRIRSEMETVNGNVQAVSQLLLNQFLAVVDTIDGFKSATLAAFASLQQAVITEGNETQAAIDRLATEIKGFNQIIEFDLHPYEFIVLAGSGGGVFRIPEGTAELFLASTNCNSIIVNNLRYPSGSQIGNEFKSVGNKVGTDGIYEVLIQPEDEISISWRSLRDLGDIEIISGDLICEKSFRHPRTFPQPEDDLQSLIDLATSPTSSDTIT